MYEITKTFLHKKMWRQISTICHKCQKKKKIKSPWEFKAKTFPISQSVALLWDTKKPIWELSMSWVHMWQSYCSLIWSATSKASSFDDKFKMQAPFHLFIQLYKRTLTFFFTPPLYFYFIHTTTFINTTCDER